MVAPPHSVVPPFALPTLPLPSRNGAHALILTTTLSGAEGVAWCSGMSAKLSKKDVENIIQSLCVVVVDDNQYMRKMVRNLLVNCGIKEIYEAADGIAALD